MIAPASQGVGQAAIIAPIVGAAAQIAAAGITAQSYVKSREIEERAARLEEKISELKPPHYQGLGWVNIAAPIVNAVAQVASAGAQAYSAIETSRVQKKAVELQGELSERKAALEEELARAEMSLQREMQELQKEQLRLQMELQKKAFEEAQSVSRRQQEISFRQQEAQRQVVEKAKDYLPWALALGGIAVIFAVRKQ